MGRVLLKLSRYSYINIHLSCLQKCVLRMKIEMILGLLSVLLMSTQYVQGCRKLGDDSYCFLGSCKTGEGDCDNYLECGGSHTRCGDDNCVRDFCKDGKLLKPSSFSNGGLYQTDEDCPFQSTDDCCYDVIYV